MSGAVVTLVLIALIAALIGLVASATGYGGFLLPAALVAILGMAPQTAVLHGLVASLLPGILAVGLHLRRTRRAEVWPLAGWLSLGTLPGLVIARAVADRVDPMGLTFVLATLVLVSAALIVVNQRIRGSASERPGRVVPGWVTPAAALGAGLVGGMATVFAGVGGPLITLPVLLMLGLPLTTALIASMINAQVAAVAGIALLSTRGALDPAILLTAMTALAVGSYVGVWLHHRIRSSRLVYPVAAASIASALWLFWTVL